jgi:hypothetical protein
MPPCPLLLLDVPELTYLQCNHNVLGRLILRMVLVIRGQGELDCISLLFVKVAQVIVGPEIDGALEIGGHSMSGGFCKALSFQLVKYSQT